MIHLTFLSLDFETVFPEDTTTKLPEAPFPFTWFNRKSISVLNRVTQNTNNLRETHWHHDADLNALSPYSGFLWQRPDLNPLKLQEDQKLQPDIGTYSAVLTRRSWQITQAEIAELKPTLLQKWHGWTHVLLQCCVTQPPETARNCTKTSGDWHNSAEILPVSNTVESRDRGWWTSMRENMVIPQTCLWS